MPSLYKSTQNPEAVTNYIVKEKDSRNYTKFCLTESVW